MSKTLIATVAILFALAGGQTFAQQVGPEQPPKLPKPAPKLTFTDRMKQYLQRTGSTVDESKSAPDMVVSIYPDAKGGKVTIVLVNDRRRNLRLLHLQLWEPQRRGKQRRCLQVSAWGERLDNDREFLCR